MADNELKPGEEAPESVKKPPAWRVDWDAARTSGGVPVVEVADALASGLPASDVVAALSAVRDESAATGDGVPGGVSGADGADTGDSAGEGGEGPRVAWLPEYAKMRMAVAICAARGLYIQAVIDSKRNKDGRITVEEKCRIVRVIALAWMRANGAFFVDEASVSVSTAYYLHRKSGRFYRVSSEEFAAWLVSSAGMEPTSREVVNLQKAVAMAAVDPKLSKAVEYRRYFAHVGGRVYISCGELEVVAVSADGVERRRNGDGDIFFPPDSCLPPWRLLPEGREVDPIDTALYRTMASVEGERSKTLIKLWLCALPFSPVNKPLLVFVGGVGSGKTKSATGVFRILGVDTRTCDFSRDSKPADFWTAVNRGGVMTVDNVDANIPWLPTALASASTGGSSEARKLYSDNEVVVRRALAWIVITTASPMFARDAGCADRILKIELFRQDKPTSDSALDAELAEKRDAILSYVVRAVRGALSVTEAPPDGLNRRHPDWAAWAWRIGCALGIRKDAEDALLAAEDDKSLFTIVSDEVFGLPFVHFMDSREGDWEGDAAELLTAMVAARVLTEDDVRRNLSARSVGKRLSASWPFYQKVFGASKRMLTGRVRYRFSPRKSGLGGYNNAFSNLSNITSPFHSEKDETGGVNPPISPTPPPKDYTDFPVEPYDEGDPLI